jgi:hypothetical protein
LSAGAEVDITGYDAELDVSADMTLGGASFPIIDIGGAGDSDYISATNGATLTIQAALVSDAKSAHVFLEDDGNGGTIINQGTMTFGDPVLMPRGSGEIDPANFDNDGFISINYQTLDITCNGVYDSSNNKNVGGFTDAALTGVIALTGGTLTVHDNGTVFEVDGYVNATAGSKVIFYNAATGSGIINLLTKSSADIYNYTGSVDFEDGTDKLWLESLKTFKGTIDDFSIGDTIDFRNVGYAAGDYVTLAGGGFNGGTVSVHNANGGVVASFVVANNLNSVDYNASNFTLTQDGSLDLVVGMTRHVVHDFNGDGTSDVLWLNTTTHRVADWSIVNGVKSGAQIGVGSATGLNVVGAGDFNDDGTSDILVQNASTLALQVWRMSGGKRSGAPVAVGGPAMAAPWSVAAIGDFNGDGTSDILWRNSSTGKLQDWTMSDDHYVSSIALNSNIPGAGWSVKGVGDFNGDGVSDVLWVNSSLHELLDWQMGGGKLKVSEPTVAPSGAWTYVGVGDFKGNGTDEALIESASHTLSAWNVVTGSHFSLGSLAVPAGFSVAGIGDYNDDGVSDVMLYNKTTGAVDVGIGSAAGHIAAWTSAGTQSSPSNWSFLA